MAGALRWARPWLAVAAAALVAACGGGDAGDESSKTKASPWVDPSGEEPYVGSLAVDPGDRALWLATNRGLYRIDRAGGRPRQVTGVLDTPDGTGQISAQLVIGFDGGAMVASGHPASESQLPPVLGLIRSTDRGRTWESVSELGAADFHVLERSRASLVGAQYGEAQVLVSGDGGRKWRTRVAPGTIVDLAVDPAADDRWVATTEDGVFASRDAGRTWRPVDTLPHVRLAWGSGGVLHRLDPDGRARRSEDGGFTWKDVGTGPQQAQALAVDDSSTLYAALEDGRIERSADGGRSWDPMRLG